MGRPQKEGLDYFPLDVDIDQDDKIALIEAQHGIVGFGVVIKLFMKIYKNGYFYEWGEKEQLLFSKRVNVDINSINAIINDCLKWGLFDPHMYETYGILTSRGIQRRYFEAVSRRQNVTVIEEYCLIDMESYSNIVYVNINGINVNGNSHSRVVNDNINPQSKVKESKVKERIKDSRSFNTANNSIDLEDDIVAKTSVGDKTQKEKEKISIPYDDIVKSYNEICTSLPAVKVLSDKRRDKIRSCYKKVGSIDQFIEVFEKAEASDFLSGRNGVWGGCNFDWLINYNNFIKVLEGTYNNKGGKHGGKDRRYSAAGNETGEFKLSGFQMAGEDDDDGGPDKADNEQ